MWRTGIITFVGVALLACNGGQGGVPTAQPTATPPTVPTATAEPKSEQACEFDLPAVALRYDDQTDDGLGISIDWLEDGCGANGHPFFTMPLPASVLTLPAAARPVLTFTEVPLSVGGAARVLPLEKIKPNASGIEISIDDLYANATLPLDMQAIAEQELDLSTLAPGEYVIQLGAEWPQGSLGFAFRIEIVEAVDE